jgi:Hemolysin-type calcium-binding repeat (2 copies).
MAIKKSSFDNDILVGTSGIDILTALHEDVLLDGGAGNDTYILDNNFFGNEVSDTAVIIENANSGTDTVIVNGDFNLFDGIDLSTRGENIENLTLTGYADYGYGNELNNILNASRSYGDLGFYGYGGVKLYGEGGNDTITGSLFNDALYGGTGNDIVNGGSRR